MYNKRLCKVSARNASIEIPLARIEDRYLRARPGAMRKHEDVKMRSEIIEILNFHDEKSSFDIMFWVV